ncbi:MAG: TonB-dependent receptor plug domain-containing protein, partial [Saprospiraceae bacterium]|nr:TonB-dependent receptor plug domain-containing protein [Saprospiraceae bacterium]
PAGTYTLRTSAVGYTPLDLEVEVTSGRTTDLGDLVLEPVAHDLDEVVVTGTMKEISRMDSPVPVELITPKLFRKNPEPSLLGAIGMVNGVRSQLNCSVCNTGDIHINGMEGPYTLVLIDGMPLVSSLGTVYGLSGIPTGLVERVEVVKGPGGALYGSEAMGGIINVVTRKPFNAPRFTAEGFVTGWNEQNLDLGGTMGLGKARMLVGVNGFRYQDPR